MRKLISSLAVLGLLVTTSPALANGFGFRYAPQDTTAVSELYRTYGQGIYNNLAIHNEYAASEFNNEFIPALALDDTVLPTSIVQTGLSVYAGPNWPSWIGRVQ